MIGLSPHWLALPTIIASPVPRHPKRVPSTLKMGPPPLFPVEVYPHLLLDSIPTYIPVHPSVCQSGSQYVRMAYIAFKCPNIVRPWLNRSIAPGGDPKRDRTLPPPDGETDVCEGRHAKVAGSLPKRQAGRHAPKEDRKEGRSKNTRFVARALRWGKRAFGGTSLAV